MPVWRRGNAFLTLLEHKKNRAIHDKKKSEVQLDDLIKNISECQQDYEEINVGIADLMSLGVLSRSEMYQRIRQQGVLMSRQQDILQHIFDLQNDAEVEKNKIQKYQNTIVACEKRHQNIARNLQRMRREALQRAELNAENDIEEMAIYGDKKR